MRCVSELVWNLGVQVLLPRFFLYSLAPLAFFAAHSRDMWSFHWFPGSVWMTAGFSCLFLLNVTANLAVSRYLRLHQTAASPYKYSEAYDSFTSKTYFRISVNDNTAFHSLIKSLRKEHKGEAISIWLWLDDLMFVPGVLFLLLGLLLCGASWLAWQLFHPLSFQRQARSWIGLWRQVCSPSNTAG